MSPVIGLISQDDHRASLIHELELHGLRVAASSFQPEDVEAVLVDSSSDTLNDATVLDRISGIVRDPVRHMCALLIRAGHDIDEPDGMTLTPSVSAFAQQLKLFLRRRDIQTEAELRAQTLRKLEAADTPVRRLQPLDKTLLYFGEPGPFYLRMKSKMTEKGYRVSAALSERTAFETFRNFVPSAFIVRVGETFYPFELLDHLHGRTDLKNMPVIAISDLDDRLPDNLDNIHGLVRLGQDFSKSIVAIETLINRANIPDPVAAKNCVSPARDKYSGCFSDRFASIHIPAQATQLAERDRSLCVARLSPVVRDTQKELGPDQLPAFSSLLGSVLRKQDMLARISWTDFVVSMPATTASEARDALARARRIVEMTDNGSSGAMSFEFKLYDYAEHVTPEQFWSRINSGQQKAKANQANVA